MNIKLEHYLHDLIWLIKEDYNRSLDRSAKAASESERANEEGQSWAYHHVLELIESQLIAFGDTSELFSNLAPEPGKKAEFTKAKFN
jgi:hypothetical protein